MTAGPGGSPTGGTGGTGWSAARPGAAGHPLEQFGDARVDAGMLAIRVDALARFRQASEPYLPADLLASARATATRANARLARSRAHTVAAIVGGTGTGKSSLFNAVTGMELSPVGLRRPTTGTAHACVWGPDTDAAPVLDWLGVPADRRFNRESLLDADEQAGLRGLILLDLPDFDSVVEEHAVEVERLLDLADLMIWVVDPQKYADAVLHERQLRRFHRHRDVTVAVLNQTDLLGLADLTRVLADLRKLLADDGLADVPVFATSAVPPPAGLAELRTLLEETVAGKRAALRRLAADLDGVVDDLAELTGPEVTDELVPDRELVDGLAEAAGLSQVTDAVARAHRERGRALVNWPVPRSLPVTPLPEPPAGQPAAVRLATRSYVERAGAELPAPWAEAVSGAGRSRLDELPEVLAATVATVLAPYHSRTPWWWRLVGVGLWLSATAAVVGLCVVLAGWVLGLVGLPMDSPRPGVALLVGGLAAGGLLAGGGRLALRWRARRAQERVADRLRELLTETAREYVVAPAQAVRRAYAEARSALRAAARE